MLPPGLQAIGMTKRFGPLVALDNVSMTVRPGSFHALLGGNGAGKSTLVKCIMGFYLPDEGEVVVGQRKEVIRNPREALALGIGMVYQHFTVVGNMTVAENLVLSRGRIPFRIDWDKEIAELRAFLKTTPFFIPLGAKVGTLAAGQKQKLEIVKQLYLKNKVLFLDEPTSVLTPQEADEVLGMLKDQTTGSKLSVLIITHKFSQVTKYADDYTVLRAGKLVGSGRVSEVSVADLSAMMIGTQQTATMADRAATDRVTPKLELDDLRAAGDNGQPAVMGVSLSVKGGEVVAVVGVSGNGQSELVQVLGGQRRASGGRVSVMGRPYRARRWQIRDWKVRCLPEEPLRNACVPDMSVAENMALRRFDRSPLSFARVFLRHRKIRRFGESLIAKYRVKTPSHATPIAALSGGNVQRAVLARELSEDVNVLVVQNPCFGLDFAAVADIRSQIMDARNRGAAVLLVTEDLDEAFQLADRVAVMFEGKLTYECPAAAADIAVIGRHMAGHGHDTPGSPAASEAVYASH
jgi:simple sugar transport system ATP-binding protein